MTDLTPEEPKDPDIFSEGIMSPEGNNFVSQDLKHRAQTLPPKLDVKQIDWDELDELLQVSK